VDGAVGVTAAELVDAAPTPAAFTAATVIRTGTPAVRPRTVTEVAGAGTTTVWLAVADPLSNTETRNSVIGRTPSAAVKFTVALFTPAVT